MLYLPVHGRLPEVRKAANESADNIGAAPGLVAEEIDKAYKRLRDMPG
jgi:hypothetical protein